MEEKIIEYLKARPAISVNRIEAEAGLAQGTLSKALHGARPLKEHHIAKLLPVLLHYGFRSEQNWE